MIIGQCGDQCHQMRAGELGWGGGLLLWIGYSSSCTRVPKRKTRFGELSPPSGVRLFWSARIWVKRDFCLQRSHQSRRTGVKNDCLWRSVWKAPLISARHTRSDAHTHNTQLAGGRRAWGCCCVYHSDIWTTEVMTPSEIMRGVFTVVNSLFRPKSKSRDVCLMMSFLGNIISLLWRI